MKITAKAYARAGLLGNPSDGYFGKIVAVAVKNFSAEVVLETSPRLRIIPDPDDENVYADITPTRATGTGNITQFETTNGSTSVIVTDSSHGALIGYFFTIASVIGAVVGISAANLRGEIEIQTVPTGTTYNII